MSLLRMTTTRLLTTETTAAVVVVAVKNRIVLGPKVPTLGATKEARFEVS
jgi:hypothetical protein